MNSRHDHKEPPARKEIPRLRGREALIGWILRSFIGATACLGISAGVFAIWYALHHPQNTAVEKSAAMVNLLDTGNALQAEIASMVRPAMERTQMLAKSPEVIAAIRSHDQAAQTAVLNAKITTSTEVDAIALFNNIGRITAINTCYADGRLIAKSRLKRILDMDFSQRAIVQGCLRNGSDKPVLEFQTHCDITPALFDSTGLSVAYSVPVIDPNDSSKIGVVSSRLRFDRLTRLIEGRPIAGGHAQAYYLSDAGNYFSESINSGREQPPVPSAELREILRPVLADDELNPMIKRGNHYLTIFSVPGMRSMEGGGIHILILAEDHWLTRGLRQERLMKAAAAGLIAALLLILAAFGHARLSALHTRRKIEEANEANARLAAIVESSDEAIMSDSLDGVVLSWNRGAEAMFGYSAEEAVGVDAALIEPDDRRGEVARLRRAALAGEAVQQFQTLRKCKDGREIDVSLTASLVRNSAGKVIAISRVVRDITLQKRTQQELQAAHDQLERRVEERTRELSEAVASIRQQMAERAQAEESLRESDERFRQLAENINDVFWMMSVNGDRVLYISPRYEQVWGRPCQSLIAAPELWIDAVQPEDRAAVEQAWTSLRAGGEYVVEYRIHRPDGAVRWIRDRALPIRDGSGTVYRVAGIAEDITARRAAELQLKEAREAAEAANQIKSIVLDTALDAIVTIDSTGQIVAWNMQAETMFRWDRTEVGGLRLDQTIIPERSWAAHRLAIETFVEGGDGPLLNTVAELVAVRRDGREFPVEVAITPALVGNEFTFTLFIRDITARRQFETELRQAKDAAEMASCAKSEFLANMSHEIRTPLNGVLGMSGLLLKTALDEKQRRFAQLVKSSGESLAQLINDILDFSKIEARKLEIESVPFDLHALVEDVCEMMLIKASQKGLELASLTMPDVPRHVLGDPGRVRQILLNLINNAVKFTSTGAITTRLRVQEQSSKHVLVRFSITDTGIGIPADRMDRLFKSFSQVDASTTRTYGGTGLGLAISKQLTELMGGTIGVESVAGSGSTFWFTIRLEVQPAMKEPSSAPQPRSFRVLAAHGSAIMRETLASQLSNWRLEPSTAASGDEAMRMLTDAAAAGQPFDVAILDSELDGTAAMDLGRAIKARPDTAKTVLILLLPMNADFEPATLQTAGFAGHLVKPVRQSRLYDTILSAMVAPASSSVAMPEPASGNAHVTSTDGRHGARILVADDNRVNQIVTTEVLAGHGYDCDVVDDGRKAVAAALTGQYDLILMDCSMPEIDGFEATRLIRQAERSDGMQLHTPIIALTANAINGDRERCLEAGMDDYVSKPIDEARLLKSIEAALTRPLQLRSLHDETPIQAETPSEIRDVSPPVDTDVLLERCMGNVKTVLLILEEFELQAVSDLADLKRFVGSHDGKSTARVAHALKGASAILSAEAVAKLAFKLERMGHSGTFAGESELLIELDDEIRRCIEYLPAVRSAIAARE